MEVLAVIAARGGSKGLPRKNLAVLAGKPLVAWTIEAALGAERVTRTIVTTDDPEIADVARRFGAEIPFMRPADLARDESSGTAPVLHAVEWLASNEAYVPDIIVNLQPTSPHRTSQDIDAALVLLAAREADTVVSVTPADPHPYWMKQLDAAGWLRDLFVLDTPITRRQDLPPVYALNGAIYAARHDALMSTGGWYTGRTAAYIMPPERSVDIDTAFDFQIAEKLFEAAPR